MRISKRLFLAAAMAAGIVASAYARTITATENKTSGVTTSFDLTFSAEAEDHSLWMVYGKTDGGSSFSGWGNVQYIGEVAGSDTSMANVPVPAGWGTTVYRIRFLLSSPDAVPVATLDYIEATGTQYVMTDFKPTGASAVEMSFAFDPDCLNVAQCLFCARAGANTAPYFSLFWGVAAGKWRMDYNTSKSSSETLSLDGDIHVLRDSSGKLTMDDTVVVSGSSASFSVNQPMSIFAANNSGTSAGFEGKFKLYSFKAWADGSNASTIALDLVPCMKGDGTACLYNKANHCVLENAGTGSFVAGSQIDEPDVTAAASDLVTASLPGWIASNGDYYPYIYPLYVADVSASNSIGEVTFQKFEEGQASPSETMSYATFTSTARTGTIVKRGDGTLSFDRDISTFTGPVHVEDGVAIGVCSNCFGHTAYASVVPDTQRTYVHSGATLVMDAIGNKPQKAEYNAVYYEGDGHPGMSGAYVFRNGNLGSGDGSPWQAGISSRAVGPTRIYVDFPSGGRAYLHWSPAADFSLNGQDVLMYGRTNESVFAANSHPINDIGNLVVSNMTMEVGGNNGQLLPKNGSASTIRFRGGSRWIWFGTLDQTGQTATTFIDDMEYAQIGRWQGDGTGIDPWGANGAMKRNWYYGPTVLNDDFRIRNYDVNQRSGCTFAAKVSGPCGFRPYQNRGVKTRLNLLNDDNDFRGGIVLNQGTLGVYGATAVPSQAGAGIVSITNGCVLFGRVVQSADTTNAWVNFTMPVTEFVNGGAVTNGTGVFTGLVKKGAGTLDYNSQMSGAYLDLEGGTVKFNTQYRDAYTGDNAAAAPSGYAASLPAFTTLKGTAGTLDLAAAGGAWTVANVVGSPSITNGNLTVTGALTVDAATAGNQVKVSGTLAFGNNATVTLADGFVPERSTLLAKAAAITGTPRLVNARGWKLSVTDGELRLVSNKPTMLIVR